MIIDFHTHIAHESMIAPTLMAELAKEHDCILDYVGLAPPAEVIEQVLKQRGPMGIDDITAMYFQMKQAAGIDMSVAFHVDMLLTPEQENEIDNYIDINKWFADLSRKNAGRLIAFAAINPVTRGEEGLEVFEECISSWGMKGLQLHPSYSRFYPNDRKAYPYYEKAAELGVPVLFHASPAGRTWMELDHPKYIDEVANDFRDLPIVISHLSDPWMRDILAILNWRANVYLDISFGQMMYLTEPDRFYRYMKLLMWSSARDRILFGTETPGPLAFMLPDEKFIEVCRGIPDSDILPQAQLEADAVDKLLGGNAARLLGV